MSIVEVEEVLVVPTERFHQVGHFQGFCSDVQSYMRDLLIPANISYRPRGDMEKDPSFKQLIPYVIFRYQQPDGSTSVFNYVRGAGQGEKRLHRKMSIGIGGHISSCDADVSGTNPYEEGMRRELDEEVIIETAYDARCVGMLNDDQTDVGRVHLGVVHVFDVDQPKIRPRERDITEAVFTPVQKLRPHLHRMESWSQICFEALFG